MISATQARELSGPGAEDYLKIIEDKIRSAAENKGRELIIRDEPYASWLYGNDRPVVAKAVIRELDKAGFSVSLYYVEMQFVDMGLWIKW